MTPVLVSSRLSNLLASPTLIRAAGLARDAAVSLAEEAVSDRDISRYALAADRISAALGTPEPSRMRVLMASPAVIEISGRSRTLIEMIEADPGDDASRFRLARLLLRALVWRADTFPVPLS